MKLKLSYESEDDIPKGFEELYTEKGDKWVLTGVEGMKTQDDVDAVKANLVKERDAHKETKKKLQDLSKWDDLDYDEVHEKLDEYDDLKKVAEGKLDDKDIDEMVSKRVQTKLDAAERKHSRDMGNLQKQVDDLQSERDTLLEEKTSGKIRDKIRKAALEAKVIDTAVDDVVSLGERLFEVDEDGEVRSRDNVGIAPGISASDWLEEQKESKPHFWPGSTGAGARGSDGKVIGHNPWSKDRWNVTEQGEILKSKGMEHAKKLAAQAGSKVGATHAPGA